MALHVLGGGSIGLLYASSMRLASRTKNPICLLLQSHHENKIKSYNETIKFKSDCVEETLKISPEIGTGCTAKDFPFSQYVLVKMKDFKGNSYLQDIPAEIIKEGNNEQNISSILLATKAPQAVPALESIFGRFDPSKKVNLVVMTNGVLGVVDGIKTSLKENKMEDKVNIIYASSTHGAMRGNDIQLLSESKRPQQHAAFDVVWTGLGQTFIEESDHTSEGGILAQSLNEIWNDVGLQSKILSPEQMSTFNWKKLATNSAINPLTALRNCRNGDLLGHKLERPSYKETFCGSDVEYSDPRLFYRLIREVSDVALAEVKHSQTAVGASVKEELSYESLVQFVENVVRATSQNKSSMLQDVMASRYPTEIEFLNRYVSRLGRNKYGLDVEANEYVSEEIEKLNNVQ